MNIYITELLCLRFLVRPNSTLYRMDWKERILVSVTNLQYISFRVHFLPWMLIFYHFLMVNIVTGYRPKWVKMHYEYITYKDFQGRPAARPPPSSGPNHSHMTVAPGLESVVPWDFCLLSC